MTQELQLKNPSITLYTFQLRNDADKEAGKLADNALNLWTNLDEVVGKFGVDDLKSFIPLLINPEEENPSFQRLLKEETIKFNKKDNGLELTIYPVRFHDTYSADLTVFYPNQILPVSELGKLNIEGCLLPEFIRPSTGQTLLFYAETIDDISCNKELAKQCFQYLLQNQIQPQPEQIKKGVLFGSPIYEYDNGELDPTKRHHILVWLNCNPKTVEALTTDFNPYFHRLLLYRHKILFSYYRSRSWYQHGKAIAAKLDAKQSEFKAIDNQNDAVARLEALKKLLAEVRILGFDYSRCLRDISECINTITTNTENYVQILATIQDLQFQSDKLQFLDKFAEVSKNKYQEQIKVDLNYLIASQNLFQEMIANIRGMVEIEQIEADRKSSEQDTISSRNLNITIGVVGGGMAAAGIVATSYGLIKPELPLLMPWDKNAGSIHPFTQSVFWSLLIGFIPVLVWALIWLKNSRKDK
ncbi:MULTISPECIES: hypothetical protein [Kamptonema]|uniref:hypothetical protein n=1 Tax=Kamptonema TaxID=1501433 RepID=UPI0001DAC983|nr:MULTISPECIES: hypothetical protein [Kamptonema]CBN56220.1 conserved hypothetical protein [Kamptonema sp. PCC 6506]